MLIETFMHLLNAISFSWKALRYYYGKSAKDKYLKVAIFLKMH